MRHLDENEAEELNAEQWQLDLLELNPCYTNWGPHEDYMYNEKGGWDSRVIVDEWKDFGFGLDDLNECVNFYFSVNRANEECKECDGNGYHPDAQNVVNTFYPHMNPKGEHWFDNITQDEVQALIDKGRLSSFTENKPEGYVPSAEEINTASKGERGVIVHDGINRYILTYTRLDRLGIPKTCPSCNGTGYVYTAESAHVSVTFWILHPRKGCSRGVEVTNIYQDDLPHIFEYLNQADMRNAKRFSHITNKFAVKARDKE